MVYSLITQTHTDWMYHNHVTFLAGICVGVKWTGGQLSQVGKSFKGGFQPGENGHNKKTSCFNLKKCELHQYLHPLRKLKFYAAEISKLYLVFGVCFYLYMFLYLQVSHELFTVWGVLTDGMKSLVSLKYISASSNEGEQVEIFLTSLSIRLQVWFIKYYISYF